MDTIINVTTIKHINNDGDITTISKVPDMPVYLLLDYINNLTSQCESVNWSMDCLNPDYTTATVYVAY